MTLRTLYRAFLALTALWAALLILGPLVLLAGLAVTIGSVFAICVTLWSVVILGEHWIDGGLEDYGPLDALEQAARDLFGGMRGLGKVVRASMSREALRLRPSWLP